jgi:uncharacterized alpha-E superfamily protein
LFDFTSHVINHCSIVRGKIQNTLMQDVAWRFIQLGMHLERANQVIRILLSKIKDINTLQSLKLGDSLELQQWNILLDCLEAKDMCRKYYNALPNRINTLEFLLLNPEFPRSVTFNLTHVHELLKAISQKKEFNKTSLEYKVGKDINLFRYLEIEEVEVNVISFLEETLHKIHLFGNLIVKEYFTY